MKDNNNLNTHIYTQERLYKLTSPHGFIKWYTSKLIIAWMMLIKDSHNIISLAIH